MIKFVTKGMIKRFDLHASAAIQMAAQDEIEENNYRTLLYVHSPVVNVPGEFIKAFLAREFAKDKATVLANLCVWDGSYHAPSYDATLPGEAMILFPRKKVKHAFSRARKAVQAAMAAWERSKQEGTKALLLRKRIWCREGD